MDIQGFFENVRRSRARTLALQTSNDLDGTGVALLAELDTAYEELRVASEELQAQNEQLALNEEMSQDAARSRQDLFDRAPAALLVTDLSGRVRVCNGAAAAMFGVEPRQLAGTPLTVYIKPADRREFRQRLDQVHAAETGLSWQLCLFPRADAGALRVIASARADDEAADGSTVIRWALYPAAAPCAAERPREVPGLLSEVKKENRALAAEVARLRQTVDGSRMNPRGSENCDGLGNTLGSELTSSQAEVLSALKSSPQQISDMLVLADKLSPEGQGLVLWFVARGLARMEGAEVLAITVEGREVLERH